jgi:hypothetical protein
MERAKKCNVSSEKLKHNSLQEMRLLKISKTLPTKDLTSMVTPLQSFKHRKQFRILRKKANL